MEAMGLIVAFNIAVFNKSLDLICGYCVGDVSDYSFPIGSSECFLALWQAILLLSRRVFRARNKTGMFWWAEERVWILLLG